MTDKENREKEIGKIKYEITDAYSKTKLNELHYNLLNQNCKELENDDNDKK